MDIRIGDMPIVKNDLRRHPGKSGQQESGRRKDRRRNREDRRKSVRDGVFVRLSFKEDRRVKPDRRKQRQFYDRLGRSSG